MPWDCFKTARFDEKAGKYALIEVCQHDCVTYQCVDDPDTERFLSWLTDEQVAAMYPHLNKPK